MRGEPRFFDVDACLTELSGKSDALERPRTVVDFELFRADPRARTTVAAPGPLIGSGDAVTSWNDGPAMMSVAG